MNADAKSEGALSETADKGKERRSRKIQKARANPKLAGWFVGQVMKATGGKANPKMVNELVSRKLAN